jgi:hypothetical protein
MRAMSDAIFGSLLGEEVRKVAELSTEAYLVVNRLPCTRRFTDAELAPYIAEVTASAKSLYGPGFEWSDSGRDRIPDYSRADYQTSGVAGRPIKGGE